MSTTCYKFRLYPTKEQQELLWKWSRALNDLYNHFVKLQKDRVDQHLPILRRFDTHNLIPSLKNQIESLGEVHSDPRQHCSDVLSVAMILWQRKKNKFPQLRSGYRFFNIGYQAFDRYCKIKDGYFIGGKLPPIKMHMHREMQGTPKTALIHCDSDNKWWVIVTCHIDPPFPAIRLEKIVGIDLGCKNLLATSDGYTISSPKFLKKMDDAINQLKSRIDTYHKPTGSKKDHTYHESRKCRRLKKTIRHLYGKRSRMMKNFLHTRSRRIVDHYDIVIVENLKVKQLKETSKQRQDPKHKNINRIMSDHAVSMFKNMLQYKSKRYLEVNPAYTSQTCAQCGQVRDDITLADRTYKCKTCSKELDRDVNAALNIRNLGLMVILDLAVPKMTINEVARDIGYCNDFYPTQALA